MSGPSIFQSPDQPIIATGAKLAIPMRVEVRQETRRMRFSVVRTTIHEIVGYGAALFAGLLVLTILPGFFRATLRETARIGVPIGVGAVALIASFALLVVGILLLFVGVGAGVAGALLYVPILYLAQIFVSTWLGNRILGAAPQGMNAAMLGRIALGLLILRGAGLIPFIGPLVSLAVILWGTGAILLGIYSLSRVEVDPATA